MERTPKQFRHTKTETLSQTLSSSPSSLFLPFVFFLSCFGVLLPTTLTNAAGGNLLEKTLLLTYAPDCSPKNNVAERALRKSLAMSIEKKTGSTFARINEGAYEGPELPMSTRIVGDYEAYSAKVITLDAVKFTESANSLFRPISQSVATVAAAAAASGSPLGCTVSEESLKRVGVDVLQLVACPLVSVEDVKQALAVDPCVASVEVDQELSVDVFGAGEIQSDVATKPHFSEGQRWAKPESKIFTSHRSHTGDADTRTVRDDSGREGKPRAPSSQKEDRAVIGNAVTLAYEEHPDRTENTSLRAKSVGSSAVENKKPFFYQINGEVWREGRPSQQDRTRSGGDTSPEAATSTVADTTVESIDCVAADASAEQNSTAPAGTEAAAGASAAVRKFPFFQGHDLQMQATQKITLAEKDTQPAASRSFVARSQDPFHSGTSVSTVFPDEQGSAEPETSSPSFKTAAVPQAPSPGAVSDADDFRRRSEFLAPTGELLFLRAFISLPKQEESDPKQISVPEELPQSFPSARQRFSPPSEDRHFPGTAVTAQAVWASEEEAQAEVAPAATATVGASVAEKRTPGGAQHQRLPSRRLPPPPRGRDDLDASYWRSKSGFHTRAYELASCEKNRVIAVIDTGIAYSHPALAANVWVNEGEIPDNDIDDDRNGFVDDVYGYNFRDNVGDPMDDHGHGTHVAGIIGALEYASDQVLPHTIKRKRSISQEQPSEEVQQGGEERQHGEEGQQQAEERGEKKNKEQRQLHDGRQQAKGGEHQQQEQTQRQMETPKSQQGLEAQRRPKKDRHPRHWDYRDPSWTRNWRVRAQQGVCGETSIAGLKFMGATGNGATSDAIKALNYAVQMNMKLSCNSWGGPSWSEALVAALEAADENGHLFIAAAGNQGKNTDEIPHYPASYQLPNVISVAATTIDDELAPFSNRGAKTVDVAAPGVRIRSTFPPDRFKELSGTSMATPVVAGLAAMLMSLPYDNTKQIKDAIIKGVDKIPAVAGLVKSGGRINAEKSVAWLVNELDLDVDYMLQKNQLKFALPHLYTLFDDALHELTAPWTQSSDGSEGEAEELHFEQEGRGHKVGEVVTDTDKEGRRAQEGGKGHASQHSDSKEEVGNATAISSSEKSEEKDGIEQVEHAPKEAENGDAVLRLLQGKCVSNCLSQVSV